MLSSLGNKTKQIILLALSALLLCALPAFAAEKIELWNGDIRKGSVSVRMNGTLREMAVDEVVSALGFAPKNDGTSLVVTMGGKKIEFWNGSNIVRAAGTIISFPTPVVTKDGHWWGEGRSLLSAFDIYGAAYATIAGIGVQGLGGRTTCLGLHIIAAPTHIAGLPVAVNVSCHVTRHATAVL